MAISSVVHEKYANVKPKIKSARAVIFSSKKNANKLMFRSNVSQKAVGIFSLAPTCEIRTSINIRKIVWERHEISVS